MISALENKKSKTAGESGRTETKQSDDLNPGRPAA